MKQSKIATFILLSLVFFSCEEDIETAKKDLNKGLLAYYTFDNQTAKDVMGNYDGVLINSPGFTTHTPNGNGRAVFLNGFREQFINIPYNPFRYKNNYTFSLWVRDFAQGILFSAISNDYTRSDFPSLLTTSNGQFVFYTGYDSNNSTLPFSYLFDSLQDGRWHLITVVNEWDEELSTNKSLKKLYVDGKLVDSIEGSVYGYSDNKCTKIHIGGDGAGKYSSFSSSMKVDNIRFYDRVLSDIEVKAIYEVEK